MTRYTKDPDAVLDYSQDWTKWLEADETITDHECLVDTGIDLDDSTHTTKTVTAWLSGGTLGNRYAITYRVTTNRGRIDDRTDTIEVRNR